MSPSPQPPIPEAVPSAVVTVPPPLSALAALQRPPVGFGDATQITLPPDAVVLSGGVPHPDVLPVAEYAQAAQRVYGDRGRGLETLRYSPTAGIPALRRWVADYEGVDAGRILLTTGGQEGLALTVLALLSPSDDIAVDDPVFPVFMRILNLVEPRVTPIPVRGDGFDVNALSERLAAGYRPKAVYTVPDFHNPGQVTLSEAKRRQLIGLAEHYGFIVIADNPYRELRFAGDQVSPRSLNDSDHVVHVNTLSKTLGPGLRLGWLVLPEYLVRPVSLLRSRIDSQSSGVLQGIVLDLLTHDPAAFGRRVQAAREIYRTRARGLIDALNEQAPGLFDIREPEGGFFLWARIADEAVAPADLYRAAIAHGVTYQQGAWFAADPASHRHDRSLRLTYSSLADADFAPAAERLAAARAEVRR